MNILTFLHRRSMLAVTLLVLLLAWPALAARVATSSGDVEGGHGEPPVWQALKAGDTLEPGDRVRTGDDGRAEIVLARATVRLYPNSVLRVPEEPASGSQSVDGVDLEQGQSLFDVLRGDRPFEVRTPEVVVSVKGTRFSVAVAGAAASVAVFHGSVGVRSLALEVAREIIVREGFVAAGSDGFELSVHDLADPWSGFSGEVLPHLPIPEPGPSQASRAALDAARASARAAAAPEAVARAAERHPEVRERIESLQRARIAEEGEGLPLPVDQPSVAGESGRDSARGRGPRRDAVADGPAALAVALEENFVEAWINGGMPGGGGTGGNPFTVTFVGGSGMPGPDQVLIEEESGQSWSFNQGFVQAVIAGAQPLPPPLVTLLASQGISDPVQFAQQLILLFN